MNIKVIFFMVGMMCSSLSARLADEQMQVMAGAAFTVAEYEAATDGMTDCQALQYYLHNTMGLVSAIERAVIKGYLIYRNYQKPAGDFAACDLGFVAGQEPTVLKAPADLTGANFEGATMTGVKLNSALLNRVNMKDATLTNAVFDNSSAVAQTVILTGANLTGASFNEVFMLLPYFNTANLTNATFTHARLPQANFQSADLTDTEFFICDLQDADFTGATCKGTKFYNVRGTVYFSGTDLTDADFDQTTMLYFYYKADNPPIFSNTTMPDGSKCTGADCIKHFLDFCDLEAS